jgi:hypothetical protein
VGDPPGFYELRQAEPERRVPPARHNSPPQEEISARAVPRMEARRVDHVGQLEWHPPQRKPVANKINIQLIRDKPMITGTQTDHGSRPSR